MNLLFIGTGKGSWIMRGQQLGAALGARVTTNPTADDFDWASIVILVKRANPSHAAEARRRGRPVVWDALDFWRQPDENHASSTRANDLLKAQLMVIQPALTIGATEAMATAVSGICIPHHCWAGLTATAPRDQVRTVGYEGNAVYLGRWAGWLETACRARGWEFVVNPPDLRAIDIFVAFRDGPWDGWICRQWKSGVKVVNAIAAGRPLIGQASAAITELRPFHTIVESPEQLDAALDQWTPLEARQRVASFEGLSRGAQDFTVAAIAEQYRRQLASLEVPCTT